MKKILLAIFLLPVAVHAQSERSLHLQTNLVDDYSGDSVKQTAWLVLARGTIGDPMTMFYRFSSINGAFFLDIKAMDAGSIMVVARDAPLDILLDNDKTITLYNYEYAASCTGCGARGYAGSDAQGVTLTYPISKANMERLQYNYVDNVRLYCADGYWMKRIRENNSDQFLHEVNMIFNTGLRP